jgi:hypothetical protein
LGPLATRCHWTVTSIHDHRRQLPTLAACPQSEKDYKARIVALDTYFVLWSPLIHPKVDANIDAKAVLGIQRGMGTCLIL